MPSATKCALLCALFTAGCVSVPPPAEIDGGDDPADAMRVDAEPGYDAPPGCDDDADGYWEDLSGCVRPADVPFDCADDDEDRFPGNLEICGNQMDEDCDELDLSCNLELVPNSIATDGTETIILNGFGRYTFDSTRDNALTSLVSVKTGSNNLLYDGGVDERLFGAHMWDQHFSTNTPTTPPLDMLVDGPAAARIRVQWVAGDGSTDGFEGDTYYTVFPDGRMHRDENLQTHEDAVNLYLTEHLSLLSTEFTHVDWAPGDAAAYDLSTRMDMGFFNPLTAAGQSSYINSFACAYNATSGEIAGFAWQVPAGSWYGPRVTLTAPTPSYSIALQFDWYHGDDFGPQSVRGDFMVYVDEWDSPVPDNAGDDPCGPMNVHAEAFAIHVDLDPTLPAAMHTGGVGDDDGDGFNEGGGYWEIDANGSDDIVFAVDAVGANPPVTSAFRLYGLDATYLPTVYRNEQVLVHGRDYLYQRGTQDAWLYLAVPLVNQDTVRIAPP